MVGINSINYLAFGPDTLVEGKVLSFCFLAFFPFHSKIAIDGEKQKELSEDKRYQREADRPHNISLSVITYYLK